MSDHDWNLRHLPYCATCNQGVEVVGARHRTITENGVNRIVRYLSWAHKPERDPCELLVIDPESVAALDETTYEEAVEVP